MHTISLLLFLTVGFLPAVATDAAQERVDICHAPPGEPGSPKIISVSPAAARAHIERHEDSIVGPVERCSGGGDEDCDGAVDCEDFDCTFDPRTDDETSDTFHCKVPECGDGFLDRGEACDDGNLANNDCCTSDCQFDHYGASCGQADTCEAGFCDEAGSCLPEFDTRCALPSLVDLPIAIDCCAVEGSTPGLECQQDYCAITAQPINPCVISTGEVVSCLEFFATPALNACWSVFDGENPYVSTPRMHEIIEDGPITVDSSLVYLDNHTKPLIVGDIWDRMMRGSSSEGPAGTDRYPDVPGIDSWVVRLPIVECQNPGDRCTTNSPKEITGALCFEIREIRVTPDRVIAGRFLCPERDPELFEECQLGPLFTY
jgi:cysteine-rich repeat protein